MGEKKQSLTIIGRYNIRVDALLDSGASTSYIDINLAKKLGYPIFENKKYKVTLGDGSEIYGYKVAIVIKIRNRIKPIMAIAIPVPEKLVIGHDFMQDNDIIIDYQKEKIRFSNRMPKTNRRLRI
jgi:predicted aspartyl protease